MSGLNLFLANMFGPTNAAPIAKAAELDIKFLLEKLDLFFLIIQLCLVIRIFSFASLTMVFHGLLEDQSFLLILSARTSP